MMKNENAVFCFNVVRQDTLAHIVSAEVEAASYQDAVSKVRRMWTEANVIFVHTALKVRKDK